MPENQDSVPSDGTEFDIEVFLESKGDDELTAEDIRYFLNMFVPEKMCVEREKVYMAAIKESTDTSKRTLKTLESLNTAIANMLKEDGKRDTRIAVLEKHSKWKQRLVTVAISIGTILLLLAGTVLAYVKISR